MIHTMNGITFPRLSSGELVEIKGCRYKAYWNYDSEGDYYTFYSVGEELGAYDWRLNMKENKYKAEDVAKGLMSDKIKRL